VRERAVMVPEEALVPQGGKQFLVLAVPAPAATGSASTGKDNGSGPSLVSRRIEAQLGMRLAGKVEILQGVAPEDLVVTAGQARVMRGDALPLRVIDIGKAQGVGVKPAGGASAPAGNGTAPRAGAPA
jgi:membrane fusion protein (multidrug efflux system)